MCSRKSAFKSREEVWHRKTLAVFCTHRPRERAGWGLNDVIYAYSTCCLRNAKLVGGEAVPFSLSHPPISPLRTKYSDQSVPP